MKTVECQSQVHVDGKVWFCAFTVQTCGVEGPVPRGRCLQWEVGVLMPALRMRRPQGHWSKPTQQDCHWGFKSGWLPLKLVSVHGGNGSRSSGLVVDLAVRGRASPEMV